MLSAYLNCLKIPELKKRLFFTFMMIALYRLTTAIPCPGVDINALRNLFPAGGSGDGGFMDMLDLFSGGALEQFAVGALGIMPYISASIILQLMTPVIPALNRMVREGAAGRQKFNMIMRILTVIICIIQGTMYSLAMISPSSIGMSGASPIENPGVWFIISTVLTLTAGAMFITWLGEMGTERGIGNGASIIITVNIVARLPQACRSMWQMFMSGVDGDSEFTIIHLLILVLLFVLVVIGGIALTQGMRKIPIRYAQRQNGFNGRSAGIQTSYLPLRVNYSSVMPIIFAGALLSFPLMMLRFLPMAWQQSAVIGWIVRNLTYGSNGYMLCYAILIVVFAFFWVANQFNPIQIADDLQKNSGYIPGVRPGAPTAEFLDHSMSRITLAGSLMLLVLALLPMILNQNMHIPSNVSQFFGGTSLLIIVGVALDTMRQIETFLINRHYDGFMSKGHLRSRR